MKDLKCVIIISSSSSRSGSGGGGSSSRRIICCCFIKFHPQNDLKIVVFTRECMLCHVMTVEVFKV